MRRLCAIIKAMPLRFTRSQITIAGIILAVVLVAILIGLGIIPGLRTDGKNQGDKFSSGRLRKSLSSRQTMPGRMCSGSQEYSGGHWKS